MTARETAGIAGLTQAGLDLVTPEMPPSAALDALEQHGLYEDAVRFEAYHLPVRAGIRWAADCVRELAAPERKDKPDPPLAASEAWLAAPTDPARMAAREAADRTPERSASTLIAMAVFFSGGSVTPPGGAEVSPPPYSAQKMIAGAVRLAVVSHDPAQASARYRKVLALGRKADAAALAPGKLRA